MKGLESFVLALIMAVIVLAVLFVIVLKLIPSISNGIDTAIKGVMKPVCCNWLNCKPAVTEITGGGGNAFVCASVCYGVCD